MKRIEAVFDYILNILPGAAKKDMRYKIISQMMRDGLIDLALIPDRVIAPMMRECGMALMFVADGDMEQLEILHERLDLLRATSERPED